MQMKTASELRTELSDVFKLLKQGKMQHHEAAELANIAGKMINSAKAQIEYYALREEAPTIEFLRDDSNAGT
jgi:hypothetical protein